MKRTGTLSLASVPQFVSLALLLLLTLLALPTDRPAPGSLELLLSLLRALALIPIAGLIGLALTRTRRAIRLPLSAYAMLLGVWVAYETAASLSAPASLSSIIITGLIDLGALCGVWVAVAVTREHRREQHRQREQQQYDPLTRALTRSALLDHQEQLPHVTPTTVAVLDVTGLTQLNRDHGHAAGDAHLRALSARLRRDLPSNALIARWGPDEFLCLLPGHRPHSAQHLLTALCTTIESATPGLPPFAFGLAELEKNEPLERAVALADQRLYEQQHQLASTASEHASTPSSRLLNFSGQLERLDSAQDLRELGLPLLRDLMHFDAVFEAQWDGTQLDLRVHHHNGTISERRDSASPVTRRAMLEGRTVWTVDYASESEAQPYWTEAGLRSLIITPVKDAGRVVGAIGLMTYHAWQAITPTTRRALEMLALQLGHALERERAVSAANSALESSLLALGLALEARDFETRGHTERVVTLALAVGRQLGLDAHQLLELRFGALLHDLGKIAIPDAILLKRGPLDPLEWSVMQSHAERGYEFASRITGLPQGALDVIRFHHERWDATGYPQGRAGEAIPLLARVFAVVDVYDALVSERPYKRAWTHEEAMRELRAQAGRAFEPDVVAAFERAVVRAARPVTTEDQG